MKSPKRKPIPDWVKDDLIYPFEICYPVIRRASEFADSQSAWNGWTEATEMFWLLSKLHVDGHRLVRCAAEIAAPVRPILKKCTANVERFLQTLDAVDAWLKKPTPRKADRVASFLPGMRGTIKHGKRISYQPTNAVFRLALGVYRSHALVDLP